LPKVKVVPIILLLFAAGTAIGQDVRYNFDKNTDFSKFKTFKWVDIKGGFRPTDLPEQQIKDAVNAELKNKGLERSDSDNADLYIGYQTAVYFDEQFRSYSSDWGYGPGWYGGGWYRKYGELRPVVKTATSDTSTIHTDHLAIDFYDSHGHDLIWRGMVKAPLDSTASPDKQRKNLQTAIAKLLKNYPPDTKNKK
jgi:hypothetical protein